MALGFAVLLLLLPATLGLFFFSVWMLVTKARHGLLTMFDYGLEASSAQSTDYNWSMDF